MRSVLALFTLLWVSHGAQISLQFTRTTTRNPWKVPSFVKGGRRALPLPLESTSVSSLLLHVRGGSDYRDPDGYYNDNDDDNRKLKQSEYDYHQEGKRPHDYYYGEQEGTYYREEEERRYQQVDDYDDRGRRPRSRDYNSPASSSSLPSIIKNGDRRIGFTLLAFGAFFTVSGVFLFFHKTLLRLGNLLFIAGVPMTIGPGRTAGYFLQPRKMRATGFLAFGIFLVFVGWPILGMALEIFGLLNLFGNMIPMAMIVLKQMPIVGGLFKMGEGKRKDVGRSDDDRYYDNYNYDDRYYRDDDQGGDDGDRFY